MEANLVYQQLQQVKTPSEMLKFLEPITVASLKKKYQAQRRLEKKAAKEATKNFPSTSRVIQEEDDEEDD